MGRGSDNLPELKEAENSRDAPKIEGFESFRHGGRMSDWRQEELEVLRATVAKQRELISKLETALHESGHCATCEQCDGLVLDYKSKTHSDYCCIECEEAAERAGELDEANLEAQEADYLRGR